MPRIVAILALPGVQLLDVSGPLDVFAQANTESGRAFYDLRVIACRAGPIRSSSGARLLPDAVAGQTTERIDTLLVAGAPDAATQQLAPRVRDWLRTTAARSRRFGSVCTGAFALAASGLLESRRLTTHWASVDALAQACPGVVIEPDSLYVRDGKLRTAAGVTAGLDLALALVEEDLGREIALRVASQLVMFFKRPGGQLQFSRKGETQPAGRSALQELQRWVAANPELPHRVPELAARVNLSPRHFARLFQAEVGVTPAAWVETARVDAARALLDTQDEAPKRVAARCGFANADMLRRAFLKHVGVTPAEYRRRFAGAAHAAA
ncbi:GlxA family transcriptional regulator [Paraburkholderia tropica]|jgi:transcriptional regulator GlxA family with amidase domain|uniref:AraC family transcriptional regulator with amidase-like domain n=2 Tax=Paraburkholderia TaxID=1822464 RepID=A0AAQ1GF44_9BURK|nr:MULTISPECIES: GlxA family transcriptional regulator [Paraburkholderia]MBB3002346.1 transcriptional regulator GlxA family with amidase domain [Paraburkholderia tropica]MBB6321734.1 transcriptional regulator GlxA family with amidase domain [Paraburkholderia tropica]MDE1140239.1 GlxA family transcriptional regulator [Paraburkholderia tropica]PXX18167.1 AraC family transcriptional regulator with amidase-like domain [Paraburkholderia tropica]PZW86149.1 AraC family transcriptional regulator with 